MRLSLLRRPSETAPDSPVPSRRVTYRALKSLALPTRFSRAYVECPIPTNAANPSQPRPFLSHLPATVSVKCLQLPYRHRTVEIRADLLVVIRSDTLEKWFQIAYLSVKICNNTLIVTHQHPDTKKKKIYRFAFATPQSAVAFKTALEEVPSDIFSYTIRSQLGGSEHSTVYMAKRVRDSGDGERASKTGHVSAVVALKRIPKALFTSVFELRDAISEYEALTIPDSPFLLHLADFFETETDINFVTPLIHNGDLLGILDAAGQFPEHIARMLFSEMLLGVKHLQDAGYLYRDMKLSNALLSEHGHVVLTDFGTAKRVRTVQAAGRRRCSLMQEADVSSSESETSGKPPTKACTFLVGRSNSFVGTRQYMSPEQYAVEYPMADPLAFTKGYGFKSDIWALGVCLYFMLTGRYPFADKVRPDAGSDGGQRQVLYAPEGLSDEVKMVICGCLEKNERKRWGWCDLMSCEWLRDVDWDLLTSHAQRKVTREPVVRFVSALNINRPSDAG